MNIFYIYRKGKVLWNEVNGISFLEGFEQKAK